MLKRRRAEYPVVATVERLGRLQLPTSRPGLGYVRLQIVLRTFVGDHMLRSCTYPLVTHMFARVHTPQLQIFTRIEYSASISVSKLLLHFANESDQCCSYLFTESLNQAVSQ